MFFFVLFRLLCLNFFVGVFYFALFLGEDFFACFVLTLFTVDL